MNREILFRGKRIDNGEWVEGFYTAHINAIHYIIPATTGGYEAIDGSFYVHRWFEVDPSTVGQYTGLTANGKRIFEGDIVEDATIGMLGDVVFSTVGVPSFGINDVHDGLQYHDGFWSDLEIIGTIHDNPELLKEEPK